MAVITMFPASLEFFMLKTSEAPAVRREMQPFQSPAKAARIVEIEFSSKSRLEDYMADSHSFSIPR
jgi:hypothetical protein